MCTSSTTSKQIMLRYHPYMIIQSLTMWTPQMTQTLYIRPIHPLSPISEHPMALGWMIQMLKIYPFSFHHLLEGDGVSNMVYSPLQRRKLGCAMHRQMMQFTACTLLLASSPPCSTTRSNLLTHSGPRPMHGMPYTVLTQLCTSMPEITVWPEMHI